MEWLIYLMTVRENQRKNEHFSIKKNGNVSMVQRDVSETKPKTYSRLQGLKKILQTKRFTFDSMKSRFQ